ncbi:MAG TPA: hypothetical protein VMT05_02545 [Terriglobales bacterium]|nr:hypothetical protein [Terriglobales bacterium]
MKPSTHKKVIVRKMNRDAVQGYVMPASFVVDGRLELMNTAGKVVLIDLVDIKGVYFVREFADVDSSARKTFATRPRAEGLWVRMKFKDNDMMEGLMPNDLTLLSSDGFLVNPPDSRGNLQRIFVPKSALAELTVLGVIGGPAARRRRPRVAPAADSRQVPMFTE